MKPSINLYRSLLIASFLLVNGLVIFGIAATWQFLNTGADRSTMLHLEQELEEAYLPQMTWDLNHQEGRVINKQTLKELEKDYKNAWYVRNIAFSSNAIFGLDDYYTKDAREKLKVAIQGNVLKNVIIQATTMAHHPKLEFFSLDGKLVVLTDKNVSSYKEIFQDETLIHQQNSVDTYQVTLLLEDGFWRIRQLVKVEGEPEKIDLKSELYMEQFKGINYYPKDHPWEMFGKNFDPKMIATDFRTISGMGFNSVRVFVPYEDFGKAKVYRKELQQLETILDIAREENLKVLVTLFDFYGNYELLDWTLTHSHAKKIVSSLKNHQALLGWDLKNEPDLDFENRGKTTVLSWLRNTGAQIKKWDPEHPITIGWSTPQAAENLHDMVDFVSFHYYGDIENLNTSFLNLKNTVGNKALVLEEFGKTSYSGIWNGFSGSEEQQKEYLDDMQKFIHKEQLSFFLWTLYDFEHIPNKVVGRKPWRKAYQEHNGILDVTGNLKESASEFSTKKKEKGQ